MVLAGKVFLVRENYELDTLAEKLKAFKIETETTVEEKEFKLVTEITDLSVGKGSLEGKFSFDTVFVIPHRGESIPVPRTFEAPFSFNTYKDRMFLTVYDKKNRANNIANEISKAVFLSLGQVVEARIDPETLRKFHEQNFEDTKIVFFDDIDIPSVDKLSLYGAGLGSTSLYSDYLTHGKLWYIVIKSRKTGYVLGVTRNCVVTGFSKMDMNEFSSFIKGEILPLIV